jgi:hypothetical protein
MCNLRDHAATAAFKEAILFWRQHGITIDTVRMDNQCSAAVKAMAVTMNVRLGFVPPNDKSPNRAERAIRTAKNHLIAARAGFHKDCPTIYLDKCIHQIEMALNLLHPYEYDPTISAYEGVFGHTINFQQHPIAPVGSKVLTWDSPSLRGTWADYGVEAVYLGPAMDHLRSFEVWVPHTSAARVTNTVWWFLADQPDAILLKPDDSLAYPPSKTRPNPRNNGTDLVGRNFVEPELGVCVIIGPGPVATSKPLPTRAQMSRDQHWGGTLFVPRRNPTMDFPRPPAVTAFCSCLSKHHRCPDHRPALCPGTHTICSSRATAPQPKSDTSTHHESDTVATDHTTTRLSRGSNGGLFLQTKHNEDRPGRRTKGGLHRTKKGVGRSPRHRQVPSQTEPQFRLTSTPSCFVFSLISCKLQKYQVVRIDRKTADNTSRRFARISEFTRMQRKTAFLHQVRFERKFAVFQKTRFGQDYNSLR